jgi:hypothetical protein
MLKTLKFFPHLQRVGQLLVVALVCNVGIPMPRGLLSKFEGIKFGVAFADTGVSAASSSSALPSATPSPSPSTSTSPLPSPLPSACSVPVCDLPAAIATLKSDTQNQRYVTVNTLRLANKSAVDPVILENLEQFGKAAEDLFVSVHEEDWLIREADTLYMFAVDGLAKYARPITSTNLISLYGILNTQELRFDVLLYWTTQIALTGSVADIEQLMTFAQAANSISLADKDDDYVSRQAEAVLTAGTDRYAQLHPYYEGVYAIELSCSERSSVVACPEAFVKGIHRMVILDTQSSDYGVRISLVSDESAAAAISFDHAVFNAGSSSITSSTEPNQEIGALRDIEMTIDPSTGAVQGDFEDTQYPGKFLFQGRAIAFVGQTLGALPPATLTVDQLIGNYRGELGSIKGTLIVKMLDHQRLAASFVADERLRFGSASQPLVEIDFQTGRWLPTQGLLMLVGVFPQSDQSVKLVLALRAAANPKLAPHWCGFEFAQYARVNQASFASLTGSGLDP